MRSKIIVYSAFASLALLIMIAFPSKTNHAPSCMAYNEVDENGKSKPSRFPAESCDRAAGNTLMQMGNELHDFKTVAAKTIASDEDAGATKAAPDRRIPVNLSDSKESFLDSVALVQTKEGWGSGFLISKCHVLTASHVAFPPNEKGFLKSEDRHLGKEVVVGFGQIDKAPWKSEKTSGVIVGFHPSALTEMGSNTGKYKHNSSKDWALVKLNKDKDGKYPGEKRRVFCLTPSGQPLKYNDVKYLQVRSVGHPSNKYVATGKLSLWQDIKCKMAGSDGDIWFTSCQARRGMSGGPILSLLADGCWMPIGLISNGAVQTGGFVSEEEKNSDLTNEITPLNKENRTLIDAAIEQNPCD